MNETKTALIPLTTDITEVRKELARAEIQKRIRDIYFKGADDLEFQLCIQTCRDLGLNPFAKQIYFIPVWDRDLGRYKLVPCIAIDGLRTIAERTGMYRGQLPPQWCGTDGVWVDVWLHDYPPSACRCSVLREGFQQPVVGIARYKSFVRTLKGGAPMGQWATMPDNMLWKCAEAQALRRAFGQVFRSDVAVEGAEPNDEALNVQTEEDVAGIIDAMLAAQTLDELDAATTRLRGATMDEAAKDEARKAWYESNTRLRAKPEPEPSPEPNEVGSDASEPSPDPYNYGPPAMTDAEVEAVEAGRQAGFGFEGDK